MGAGARNQKGKSCTDEAGWTYITHGPRRRIHDSKGVAKSGFNGAECHNGMKRMDLNVPVHETARTLERYAQYWRGSKCSRATDRHLQNILKIRDNQQHEDIAETNEVINQDGHCGAKVKRISKCVCLGLGSLTDGRESSRHQMAALEEILESHMPALSAENVYFQDPVFNASDIAYLESRGHVVVETPAAFDIIDPFTFLFAPHLEREVYALALAGHVPALCISGDMHAFLDAPRALEQNAQSKEIQVFETIVKAMHSVEMPPYERDTWCHCTRIYWPIAAEDPQLPGD